MKHLLQFLLCGLLLAPTVLFAQMGLNAPTGLAPRQDMEIYTRNGFLVQEKFRFTTADPNASINTLSCAVSPPTLTTQAGILKDPGSDSNYPASLTCTQTVFRSGAVSGYEVIFEDLDTEANQDLVIITDAYSNTLAFSGSTVPASFFVAGISFVVRFQANGNGTVGRGFQLRWREVYDDMTTVTPNTAFGNALQFDVNKASLLSGFLSTGAMERAGYYVSALGYQNTASGYYSSALGFRNTASSNASTALGDGNKEHFRPLNHAEMLGKLGTLKLGSWNYKGQPDQRHYGPMAQDFFARFGHNGVGIIGCDTLLADHDFTAITLAGVQALIEENKQLKAKMAQMESQTNARLEALEALLLTRRRGTVSVRK